MQQMEQCILYLKRLLENEKSLRTRILLKETIEKLDKYTQLKEKE